MRTKITKLERNVAKKYPNWEETLPKNIQIGKKRCQKITKLERNVAKKYPNWKETLPKITKLEITEAKNNQIGNNRSQK